MLSAAELAQLRADAAAAALDQPCTIQRKTRTSDGMGQSTYTWTTISPHGLMAGMTEPTAGQLQNYDYVIGSLAAWHVRLPYGTTVQYQDRLLIGDKTLTVQVVLEPRSYAALLSVLASEVV